jgi:hypothetical protein
MPIAINGSGTITGISAGGLPDDCITTADIAANAVTTAKLGTSEASGLAKAWVNFNGTGTVAIRASFNVSSITDNGTGNYTVNFTTALADANYVTVIGTGADGSGGSSFGTPSTYSTTAVIVQSRSVTGGAAVDETRFCVSIFR